MPTAAAWEFGLARQEARSTEDSAFGKGLGHYHQQNTQGSGVCVCFKRPVSSEGGSIAQDTGRTWSIKSTVAWTAG